MDFEPIYPAGFYDINLDQLESIFVTPFSASTRRADLTKRFRDFLEKFNEVGINAEIWIDGSYATRKPEPADIDVVFFCDPKLLNALSADKKGLIKLLFDRNETKIRYNCEVFLIPTDNFNLRAYWRGWLGFARDETPKGIPRLMHATN